ncbi:MAG TPA: acyltransferase [Caulobacteraceae bacterium]|jgi:peptidoglycan/LPS O-acetylase OafA/YrhL
MLPSSSPSTHNPGARNLGALTALRFFPAMWVVLYDYWPNLGAGAQPPLVAKGYLGVELFFTLSGFILCHVYLGALGRGDFRYSSFLKARLARVYPLHLASLTAIGAMALGARAEGLSIDPNILSWSSLPANLLLVQAWGLASTSGWNHPSWSVSAEWFAYLAFPLFGGCALALRRRPRLAVIGSALALAGLYTAFQAWSGSPLTEATIRWGALRIVPCFAYGCALYLAWSGGLACGRAAGAAGTMVAVIFGALGLIFAQIEAPDLTIVLALGLIIPGLASASSSSRGSTVWGLAVYLGEISYAIYMVSVPWNLLFVHVVAFLFNIQKGNMPLFAWIILMIGVIPVAALAHHLVERPGRLWVRSLPAPIRRLTPSVA